MKTAKGFTLIELLVVITIIGILATGATALYSGSQQKARDGVRMNDATVMKGAVEQAYTDTSKYPAVSAAITTGTIDTLIARGYLGSAPVDSNIGAASATATELLGLLYNVDTTNFQKYEVSVAFEAPGNVGTGLKTDEGGNNANRFEVGNGVGDVATALTEYTPGATPSCKSGATGGTGLLVLSKTGLQAACTAA